MIHYGISHDWMQYEEILQVEDFGTAHVLLNQDKCNSSQVDSSKSSRSLYSYQARSSYPSTCGGNFPTFHCICDTQAAGQPENRKHTLGISFSLRNIISILVFALIELHIHVYKFVNYCIYNFELASRSFVFKMKAYSFYAINLCSALTLTRTKAKEFFTSEMSMGTNLPIFKFDHIFIRKRMHSNINKNSWILKFLLMCFVFIFTFLIIQANAESCATQQCCIGFPCGNGCSSSVFSCTSNSYSCAQLAAAGCPAISCGNGTCTGSYNCGRCHTCSCTVETYGVYEGTCCNDWKCGPPGNRYSHNQAQVCSGRLVLPNGGSSTPILPPAAGRGRCEKPNECICSQCYGHGYFTSQGRDSVCAFFRCNGRDANNPNVCSGHGRCGCAPNPNLATVQPYPAYEPCYSPCDCTCERDTNNIPLYLGNDCQYPVCNGIPSNNEFVCNQRGSCTAPGTCVCSSTGDWGFTGQFCETLKCAGKTGGESCGGPMRGECTWISGTNQNECACNYGYTGNECQYTLCNGVAENNPNVCNGGVSGIPARGICTGINSCTCSSSWTGSNCEIHKCNGLPYNDPNSCGGHGSCNTNQITNACACDSGWTFDVGGTTCTTPVCFGYNVVDHASSNVCSGHGACVTPDTCNCELGWTGNDCSQPICHSIDASSNLACSSHGSCVHVDTCDCHAGYTGNNCQYFLCNEISSASPTVCSSHGSCTGIDHCNCNVGYTGLYCEQHMCFEVSHLMTDVCSNHGSCTNVDKCTCQTGYTGEKCQYPICYGLPSSDPTTCSGHGVCSDSEHCDCEAGYTGDDCSSPLCFGISSLSADVCSSHGTCTRPDNCNCDAGYTGSNCDIPICYGLLRSNLNSCSAHGDCVAPNTCSCSSGYTGSECEFTICFSKVNNDPSVCSSHGQCIAPDTCSCKEGYPGDECQYFQCNNIISSNINACNGHGVCIDYNTCECEDGWTGSVGSHGQIQNCNIWTCNNIRSDFFSTCSGHGQCIGVDQCKCNTHYSGLNCEQHYCTGVLSGDSSVCLSRGDCIAPNTCQCTTPGYTGNNCEFPICSGVSANDSSVCSGHGFCFSPDSCSYCASGYTGEKCEINICYGIAGNEYHVCNGHGSCIQPDVCQCNPGYVGDQCEIVSCNDILSNDSTVCSGRGFCVANDHCECHAPYLWGGNLCDVPKCLGVLSTSSEVCSGHGTCSVPNVCVCLNGWKGEGCSLHHCQGQNNCNGHGDCVDADTCSCSPSWVGTDCSIWTCQNVSRLSSKACSSHGSCVAMNKCECDDKWIGEACENFSCFGISQYDSSVCNGQGNCTGIDICTCDSNFIGNNCSFRLTACSSVGSSMKYAIAEDCDSCNFDTSVEYCKSIINPTFTIDGDKIIGIFFISDRTSDSVPCNKILSPTTLTRVGKDPVCHWLPGTNHFEIVFGEGSTITNGDYMQINLMPFEEGVTSEFATVLAHASWNAPPSRSKEDNFLVYIIAIGTSSSLGLIISVIIMLCCIVGVFSICVLLRVHTSKMKKVSDEQFSNNPIQSSEAEHTNSFDKKLLKGSTLADDASISSGTTSSRESRSPEIFENIRLRSKKDPHSDMKKQILSIETYRGMKRIEALYNESSNEAPSLDPVYHPHSLSAWFSRDSQPYSGEVLMEALLEEPISNSEEKWLNPESRRETKRDSIMTNHWKSFITKVHPAEP